MPKETAQQILPEHGIRVKEPIFRFNGKAGTISVTDRGETKVQKVVLVNREGMSRDDTSAKRTVSEKQRFRTMGAERALAQTLLLENDCTELPIKVYPISKANGVKLKMTSPGEIRKWCGGLAVKFKQNVYAFVDPSYNEEYQRFTAAHELGHAMLGHVGSWTHIRDDGTVRVVQRVSRPDIESEANAFAGELLAPECVMVLCGAETAEEIAKLCWITSKDAAPIAERIRQRRQSGQPFTPTEQQLVRRFADYIRQHTTKEV